MTAFSTDPGNSAGRDRLGVLLCVVCTFAYGTTPILGRYVYDAGAAPFSLLAVRNVLCSLLLFGGLLALGRPIGLPAGRRFVGLAVGVFFAAMSYGYMGAVKYIPVSLAALLFFSYPIMVALFSAATGSETIGWRRGLGSIAAFGGIALALGVSFSGLDPFGIFLALFGAVTFAGMILLTARLGRGLDSVTINLHGFATAAAIFLPAALLEGVQLPMTPAGWAALVAMAVSFGTGIALFFTGLAIIGPVRASLIQNMEPVFTILLAVVLLGEALSPAQVAGAAIVLVSTFLVSR